MAWKVELSATAERELNKLYRQHSKRLLKFLQERIATRDDPRGAEKALQGSRQGEFWKYRLGDYRLICKIEEKLLLVLVLRIGPRKEIYR